MSAKYSVPQQTLIIRLILLEDVKSVGKKGDIVEVSDGYARNVIIKQKKGVEANKKNLNDPLLPYNSLW